MVENLDILPLDSWFDGFSCQPMIIAGPCSAESEAQVLETARDIVQNKCLRVFRAGVWKPRTRPNTFEGAGEKALKWLQQVKQETGLLLAVEVATPEHVEKCLEHDIDILWIGARTSANPFSVQAIADALKGHDKAVMVKNPVNPDLNQWIGSLERLNKAGVKKLAAVHRGFFPYESTFFRNIPKWEIPIELKSRFHNLPIICDPSHISGNTELIHEVSQKALDLNMDGLMIETHHNPTEALSDAQQQLTPNQLNELLTSLKFRLPNSENREYETRINEIREQIDSVDSQMLDLLRQRMDMVRKIGEIKSENNVAVFQLNRWEKIRDTRMQWANKLGLSLDFVKRMLQLVHKESIQQQTDTMKKINGKDN